MPRPKNHRDAGQTAERSPAAVTGLVKLADLVDLAELSAATSLVDLVELSAATKIADVVTTTNLVDLTGTDSPAAVNRETCDSENRPGTPAYRSRG